MLCMLANSTCNLSSALFRLFLIIRVSNSLNPDQAEVSAGDKCVNSFFVMLVSFLYG